MGSAAGTTIRVQKPGYCASDGQEGLRVSAVSVQSGTKLVLHRAGSLEFSVLIDPNVSRMRVTAAVTLSGIGGGRSGSHSYPLPGGRYQIDSVMPGIVSLTIRADGHDILQTVKNLRIEAGKICRDKRLRGIDLRGRVPATSWWDRKWWDRK